MMSWRGQNPHGGRFVFEAVDFKPSREGLRAAGAPPCAPQAKILGDKGSREGFGAETLPGGFWGGNPPGRVCGVFDGRQTVNPPGSIPGGSVCPQTTTLPST
jgi:hypothetical protein